MVEIFRCFPVCSTVSGPHRDPSGRNPGSAGFQGPPTSVSPDCWRAITAVRWHIHTQRAVSRHCHACGTVADHLQEDPLAFSMLPMAETGGSRPQAAVPPCASCLAVSCLRALWRQSPYLGIGRRRSPNNPSSPISPWLFRPRRAPVIPFCSLATPRNTLAGIVRLIQVYPHPRSHKHQPALFQSRFVCSRVYITHDNGFQTSGKAPLLPVFTIQSEIIFVSTPFFLLQFSHIKHGVPVFTIVASL